MPYALCVQLRIALCLDNVMPWSIIWWLQTHPGFHLEFCVLGGNIVCKDQLCVKHAKFFSSFLSINHQRTKKHKARVFIIRYCINGGEASPPHPPVDETLPPMQRSRHTTKTLSGEGAETIVCMYVCMYVCVPIISGCLVTPQNYVIDYNHRRYHHACTVHLECCNCC